jgi:hypothetical protein
MKWICSKLGYKNHYVLRASINNFLIFSFLEYISQVHKHKFSLPQKKDFINTCPSKKQSKTFLETM